MVRPPHTRVAGPTLFVRAVQALWADNCLDLAAQLAFYFFLALFPALLFLVALVSFVPVAGLLDAITGALARVAPAEVIAIVQHQVLTIAHSKDSGLLTLGMIGTIWSTSTGVSAIIDALNHAYDVLETRSWWKVKAIALVLTLALTLFLVVSFALVLVGPAVVDHLATQAHLGPAFEHTWRLARWPVVFALVAQAIAFLYYFGPDVAQRWAAIAPGSIVATLFWILISLGFRYYVANFTSYNAAYGAIGGVIVLLLWFYVSSLAILFGAELNAEIEHASPDGKAPGEQVPGSTEPTALPILEDQTSAVTPGLALARGTRDVDAELAPTARGATPGRVSVRTWLLGGAAVVEALALIYLKLRRRATRFRV